MEINNIARVAAIVASLAGAEAARASVPPGSLGGECLSAHTLDVPLPPHLLQSFEGPLWILPPEQGEQQDAITPFPLLAAPLGELGVDITTVDRQSQEFRDILAQNVPYQHLMATQWAIVDVVSERFGYNPQDFTITVQFAQTELGPMAAAIINHLDSEGRIEEVFLWDPTSHTVASVSVEEGSRVDIFTLQTATSTRMVPVIEQANGAVLLIEDPLLGTDLPIRQVNPDDRLALAPTPQALVEAPQTVLEATVQPDVNVNLRDAPNGRILTVIPGGTPVLVVEDTGGEWVKVVVIINETTQEGYMHRDLVIRQAEPPPTPRPEIPSDIRLVSGSAPGANGLGEGPIETEGRNVSFGVQNGILDGTIIVNGREIQIDQLDFPTSDTIGFGMTVHNFDDGSRDVWVNGAVARREENQFIELERPGGSRYEAEVRSLIVAIPMKVQIGNSVYFTGESFLIRGFNPIIDDRFDFAADGRTFAFTRGEDVFSWLKSGDRIHLRIFAYDPGFGSSLDCDEGCWQRRGIIRRYNLTQTDRMYSLYTNNQNVDGVLDVGLIFASIAADNN